MSQLKYVVYNSSEYFGDKCPLYYARSERAFAQRKAIIEDLFDVFAGECDDEVYTEALLREDLNDAIVVELIESFNAKFMAKP